MSSTFEYDGNMYIVLAEELDNIQHGNVQHGNVQHGNVQHGNVQHGNVQHGNVQQLDDGRTMNCKQLCLEAIKWDVSNRDAFKLLTKCTTYSERFEFYKSKQSDLLNALVQHADNSMAYFLLGYSLEDDATLNNMDRFELFLKAIECDPTNSYACYSLGCLLTMDETIELSNGQQMNKRTLYLRAIQCDPNNSDAYNDLGCLLSHDERFSTATRLGLQTIELSNGQQMNERQLYSKAIQCNPTHPDAYHNLACLLSDDETVELLDGRVMNKRALYLKAIQCDPNDSIVYNHLGELLSDDETVELLDGRVMNKRQLYLKAIQCNPGNPCAYQNLGNLL